MEVNFEKANLMKANLEAALLGEAY